MTDFNVRPEPALPTMGPAGSKIIDPTFGTTILRVTDSGDGSFGRTPYSTYPSVNVNSTRVMGNVNSGGQTKAKFWVLNPTTFTLSGGTLPSGMPNMQQFYIRWSGTNPDVMYGSGGNQVAIWQYNIATNTGGVLKDLSGLFPAGYQSSQIQQDLADNVFSMNVTNSGGSNVGYLVWKRNTDTVLMNVTDSTNDETYVDKTGRYFYSINNSCSARVYDLSTTPPTFKGSAGFCHNGVGTGVVFSDSGSSMAIRPLATMTSTILMSGYFTQANGQSHHQSLNSTDESYALVSRHSTVGGGVSGAFDNELILVATSGNAVKRIAHHRSRTGTGYGYYDTPFANISPDGQFVAFTSNWGGTSGNNRQDLYLVKIPAVSGGNTTPPAPPSGLIVR